MEVHAAEVDQPEECVDRVDDDVADGCAAPRLRGLGRDPDPLWKLPGCVLDPLEWAPRPVVVPLQRQRPVTEVGQENRRHCGVVLERIPLPEADVGPPQLIRVMDGRHTAFMSRRGAEESST